MKFFILTLSILFNIHIHAGCVENFFQNERITKIDANEIGAAAMVAFGVNFTYQGIVDLGYGPVVVLSSSLGGFTYHLGKQYYQKKQIEKINQVYADLDIGYGVFLTRFMKEVDPTAAQERIKEVLREVNNNLELCMEEPLKTEVVNGEEVTHLPKLFLPTYEDMVELVRSKI